MKMILSSKRPQTRLDTFLGSPRIKSVAGFAIDLYKPNGTKNESCRFIPTCAISWSAECKTVASIYFRIIRNSAKKYISDSMAQVQQEFEELLSD